MSLSMIKSTLYQFIIIIIFSIGINAQVIDIEKVVFDVQEKNPINNVHVLTSKSAVYTNERGEFKIKFESYLEFSHVGYNNVIYNDINEIPDTIWLNRKTNAIEDVIINSKREIRKIEKVSGFAIKNFEVINNHIVVFKKSYVGKKSKLSLYDLDGSLVDELDFDYNFENIYTSCIGKTYLRDKTNCHLIHVSNDQLILGEKSNRADLEKVFAKCVLFYNRQWIYEYEKSSGLERTIVSIRDGKDTRLKNINLKELALLKRRYQWKIDRGARVSNITTNDEFTNGEIRDMQEESDFLDNVVLKAHEENSFATMQKGILIANALMDSLHYLGDKLIEKPVEIGKQDFVLNNVEKSKTYLFQKKESDEYTLFEIDEGLNIQPIHSIESQKIFRLRIYGNKIFYLAQAGSNRSVKINLYYENL